MLVYVQLLALLSITSHYFDSRMAAFLASYNAKVIQPLFCITSCKGACGAQLKWLCWEFGVSIVVFVLL